MKLSKLFFLLFFYFFYFDVFTQEFITPFELPDKKKIAYIPDVVDLGTFRAGENVRFVLNIKLNKGWYIYSFFQNKEIALPTNLKFFTKLLHKIDSVFETTAIQKKNTLNLKVLIHQKTPSFYQNFFIPSSHKLGEENFQADFFYQLCSERICFPPEKKSITVNYKVEKGEARADFLILNRQIDSNLFFSTELEKITNLPFWQFLLLAIFSGYLALLTPCAFASLPLVVLFFANRTTNNKKKLILFGEFFLFLFGIAIFFIVFGLGVSSFLGIRQLLNFSTNGWSFLFVAFLFLLFSVHFFGFFSWNFLLPAKLISKQNNLLQQNNNLKTSFLKILLGGSIFSITTFSCTFPLIGALLVAASFGDWFYPVLGMFLFALSFTSPLLLFYFFPQLLTKWKKGILIKELKFLLGLLTFFVCLKFFSYADIFFGWGVFTRYLVLIIWIVALSIWVFRLCLPLFKTQFFSQKTIFPTGFSLFLILVIIFLTSGISNKSLGTVLDAILPSATDGYLQGKNFVSKEKFESLQWLSSVIEAKILAKKQQKPILIDFSGKTCTNCRWMEQSIFPQKQVFQNLQENFILVRLYTDVGKNAQKNLVYQKNKFNNIGLPFYAIISSDGIIIKQQAGVMSKKQFLAFLKNY